MAFVSRISSADIVRSLIPVRLRTDPPNFGSNLEGKAPAVVSHRLELPSLDEDAWKGDELVE